MSSTLPKAPRSKSNSAGTAEKKPQIKKGIKKVPKKVIALAATLAKDHQSPSEGHDGKHPAKGSRDTATGQQVKQEQKSSSSSSSSSLSLDKKSKGKFKI